MFIGKLMENLMPVGTPLPMGIPLPMGTLLPLGWVIHRVRLS